MEVDVDEILKLFKMGQNIFRNIFFWFDLHSGIHWFCFFLKQFLWDFQRMFETAVLSVNGSNWTVEYDSESMSHTVWLGLDLVGPFLLLSISLFLISSSSSFSLAFRILSRLFLASKRWAFKSFSTFPLAIQSEVTISGLKDSRFSKFEIKSYIPSMFKACFSIDRFSFSMTSSFNTVT